ncbi:MAG TPA: glutamine-hydrolyzing GMP synthase [Candidatus Cloacimonadota bacterium]|nr:glutamine-hydrolyzing GMP synthase [Candidatus Cloacimonadota bacterium]HOF59625.1 glutamine-hydrolyzing GMP synthase [Candidatus Cloacimonadota bacterium]HPB09123.1 glutamine-hydrolyzing GMP synthase [Candidatus Cloacimonadota bacterium]HPL23129.1 glutamine-hydrolyzing GMP synthase [Candidatus Cloacimonadota bacterium]HQO44258.1 glutamine-hydrolyzing GMP synthase [Candidatus Cloacimonadota bacterium]
MKHGMVLILDFGSQYTQLIARAIRSLQVYCEIHPFDLSAAEIKKLSPQAVILSGSPFSINQSNAPRPNQIIWELGVPILGICYGMQLVIDHYGGRTEHLNAREYGFTGLTISEKGRLLEGLQDKEQVWMSHGDSVSQLPAGFRVLANTPGAPYAVIEHESEAVFALQFHPEVVHTTNGKTILGNFILKIANCKQDWTPESFISESISRIREQTGDQKVILGLSGGVDSSVAALLLYRAIGDRLIPIFVDNGCMRYMEAERVREVFSRIPGFELRCVDASDLFLSRLKGVKDPESKRKIIGTTFIEVFEQEAEKYDDVGFLAQGTLYPDVIESVSANGPSVTIKSHHNVGGLPEKMNLELVEPFRELFKDEVREVGRELGLPQELIQRHPFPGPGLAVRILSAVDKEKVSLLQKIDEIYINELRNWGLYDKTWQAFAVLLPVQSVGVMGDERTYENVCALRAVDSVDGMTADWTELPFAFLKKVSNRIINEVKGVNRVVYDISSKPPATIEWE